MTLLIERTTTMTDRVLYKGIECTVFLDYGNGFLEIRFGETITLVKESEIKKLELTMKN
jgi:hypothetical protein